MGPSSAQGRLVSFKDQGSAVLAELDLGKDLSSADIRVETTADTLTVTRTSSSSPLFKTPQLYGTVQASATSWSLQDDGTLQITLKKLPPFEPWPALETSAPDATESSKKQPSAGDALEARKNVKALLEAAQNGNVEMLKGAALRFPGQPVGDVKDANGCTALHFAAQLGHFEACQHLLAEMQVPVNCQDGKGYTPLALAAQAGCADVVQHLLQQGADPNLHKPGNAGPLHCAASSGNAAVVDALTAAGAAVDAPSPAGTPLLWAAGSGQAETVRALLVKGCQRDAVTEDGVGAALMAAAMGSLDTLTVLEEHKVDVNLAAHGVTALHAAAEAGELECAQVLLKAGADADARDGEGNRPIDAAAAAGQKAVVKLLLPHSSGKGSCAPSVDELMASAAKNVQSKPTEAPGPSVPEITVPQAEVPIPEEAARFKRQGDEAFVKKDFEGAKQAYSQSILHSTSDPLVWANRSAACLRLHDYQSAYHDARISRVLRPSYVKAWFREGSAAEGLTMYQEAAEAYFEGCRVDPDNRDLAQGFQRAVAAGRKQHAERQEADPSQTD
ncbi:hypothetical protein WJX74_007548 [Apatococcus lobatus]|uniref:CS domain-containing protein n=1 Tax=Apatococcus lobatus TaxID=904363 RepID=A0AAW1RJ64_9CHLO